MKPKFPTNEEIKRLIFEEIRKIIFLLDIVEELTDKYCIINIKIDLYHLVLFRVLFIDHHIPDTFPRKLLKKLI